MMISARALLASALRTLSRETLFLYVFHVLLVYGDRVGLAAQIGPVLGPWQALGVAAGVIALSAAAALAYRPALALFGGRVRRPALAGARRTR